MSQSTCTECGAVYERPDDIPFAPRICDACVDQRREKIQAMDRLESQSTTEAAARTKLDVLAKKIPSPNIEERFPDRAAWMLGKAWYHREERQKVVFFCAPTGSAKTRMAVQLSAAWVRSHPNGELAWWGGQELKAAVAEAATRANNHTMGGLRAQLGRAGWLVIDDLLAHTKASPAFGEFLLGVLDERINRGRPTLLTMQCDQDGGASPSWQALVVTRFDNPVTGEAFARRLHQYACPITTHP